MGFVNGLFSRLYSWVQDRDNGIKINATRFDDELDNLAEALNEISSGGMVYLGPIKAYAGTAAAPGLSFDGDTDTGVYRIGANNVGVAVAGSKVVDIASSGISVSGVVNASKGADLASAATLDLNTASGMFPDITGTTSVTAVTLSTGKRRFARAVGSFQITASATLIVNGSQTVNYTTAANDLLVFEGFAGSVVRVWSLTNFGIGAAFTPASSAGPASLALAEDTDNGANKVSLQAAASLSADRTVTFPDKSGTVAMTSDLVGQQTIWVPAAAMTPATTNGAAFGTAETTTNKVMTRTLDFDASTEEFAQFMIQMPKGWNEGTLIAQFIWTHGATTTNFGVCWGIEAVAFANDDALDTAWGAEVDTADTGGTTGDVYITDESAAVTAAGAPGAEELVAFRITRVVANAGDTMAVDAKLIGVKIHYTTDAATDD